MTAALEDLLNDLKGMAAGDGTEFELLVPDDVTLGGRPVPEIPTGVIAALLTDAALGSGLSPAGWTSGLGGQKWKFTRAL
jgi:hypothetical protein